MRKKLSRPRNIRLEAQAAAYLSSQGNAQARVAEVLGVSQGEVSRLLGLARQEGWLRTECTLPPDAVAAVEQLVFSGRNELVARLRREAERHGAPAPRGVRIFHSGGEGEDPPSWDRRSQVFGRVAASRVQELLPVMRLVGVTWGKTIARVVDGLRQLNPQPPALPAPIRFIPLTGEPLTYPDPETSSSNLAHWLNDLINGGASHFHSLAAVPAFVPAKFTGRGRTAVRDFIAEIAGYRVIFEATDKDGR